MSPFSRPSRFWEELAAEHTEELASEGFEAVKRRQALRYFTWQWDWRRIRSSEQFRFLLRHSSMRSVIMSALTPNPLLRRVWKGVTWRAVDRYLYVLATRLLWDYAEAHGDAEVLALGEPSLGSPFPVYQRGKLISQDLANSAVEVRTIRSALPAGYTPRHIVEIGGGYGRTAFVLLSLYPDASYTIVDIEPARTISHWYLTTLFPFRDICFLSPSEIDEHTDPVDLAISISSLQEMLPAQIGHYLQWMDVVTKGGFVYLKQWDSWRNPIDEISVRFDDYQIPAYWVPTHDASASIQTAFRERVWSVPAKAAS